MKFNVSAQLIYAAQSDGTVILNIQALRTTPQNIISEEFTITPQQPFEELATEHHAGRLTRFTIKQGETLTVNYNAVVENNWEIIAYNPAKHIMAGRLDGSILPYLYPSRYCQCDKLHHLAQNLFGKITDPYDQTLAIVNWINRNVAYRSGSSTEETSAYDTVTQQEGVCRDFAHLGIALCRALAIPARYFTGYAYRLIPQDFHACFEAYLGGHWILFDATRLVALNGLVKIANGRDAADASLANFFGNLTLNAITVNCQLAEGEFEPIYHLPSVYSGISYL